LQKQKLPLHEPPAQGHSPPMLQSALHVIVLPQLSVTVPEHRLPHVSIGVQPHAFGPPPPPPQTLGEMHVLGHKIVCPQLFTFNPQATPAHVVASGSGLQQVVP